MQLQLPSISASNLLASRALALAISIWVLLAVAAIFVMTLGTDEAWVLNGLRSALRPQVQNLSTELIVTSGGVFALLNLAVEWTAGSQVWLHRLCSLLALGMAFALILRRVRTSGTPSLVQWLSVTPLMAVPGAIEVGTAALGTSVGLMLMVASMLVWSAPSLGLAKRVIYGGLLFGLAAASRFDLALFGFAVLLVSCVHHRSDGRIEVRLNLPAWAFVGIGMSVFLLNQWVMSQPANAMLAENIGASTGLGGWALNYPKLLNHWSILNTHTPLSLLALMLLSAFWLAPAGGHTKFRDIPRFESLLAVTGLVLLAGWLFRAPIAHLRYAFPALFCFAALGAVGLQRFAIQSFANGTGRQWLLCQCLGLVFVIGSIGTTTRSLVMSDSDYASWEWTHEMPYDYFRRFEARQHQGKVAVFLRDQLAPDARLYSYVPYALRYLTERPVVAVDGPQQLDLATQNPNRYLVLTPAVGTYFYMNPKTADWLQTNAQLVKQIGRYSVYQLPAGSDVDLENMQLRRTNYEKHPGSSPWFGH